MIGDIGKNRKTEYEIDSIFIQRWSPRKFSGEELSDSELMSLFEAARWAPSSYNDQPWRFIYAKKNTAHWDKLFGLMGEFNQEWAKDASVLIVVLSHDNYEQNDKPNNTASFTVGAAMQNLLLEATKRNIATHPIGGFDSDKAVLDLKIPQGYSVCAMIVVGKPASDLSDEELSDRKKVSELIMEGEFKV